MSRQPLRRLYFVLFCFSLASLVFGPSCNCESESIGTGFSLDVKVSKPLSGPVSGDVPVDVSVAYTSDKKTALSEDVRMVQVFLTPQGGAGKERQIAEMYKAPFTFNWKSIQSPDGFYLLKAVALDGQGAPHESKRALVQVVNTAPELWFVNCFDGQFVRGTYSLVVSLHRPKTSLKAPPSLSINGLEGPKTKDKKHPYRFEINTRDFKEGEHLSLAVRAEDLRGNSRNIVCRPRVDNVLPTIRFVSPNKEGILLGRSFEVSFAAFDLFGVKEVRLWIDGSACSQSRKDPDPSCSKNPVWSSKKGPSYPIKVDLTDAYKTEQTILLTARAVDQAGNVSEPAAKLRIRIDPVPPEIFVRSPGQGELVKKEVTFTARITDNDLLKRVTFRIDGAKGTPVIIEKRPNQSELTLTFTEPDVLTAYGRGRRYLVVTAEDISGNKTEVRRLFNIGCTNSADCPVGKVCHKFACKVPVGLGELCDDDHPCALQSSCVLGKAPHCSKSKLTYCRQRCHPGNKVVSPEPCPRGFFCSKGSQTCLPTDQCLPLKNLCKSNEQCVPVDDDSNFCLPVGSVRPGGPCQEDCTPQGNCSRGFWCVYDLSSGGNACMQACDTRAKGTCPSGQRCAALRWSFGGAPLAYGVCFQ